MNVLAVSETPFWLIALPVIATLLGVVIAQIGPEFFRRRATAEARYDAAIIAVGKAFAARHGVGLGFPREWSKSPDAASHAAIEQEFSKATIARFLDASAEARTALAALYPWSPDLRKYWDRPFMPDDAFDPLTTLLTERRRSPLKRYKLDDE